MMIPLCYGHVTNFIKGNQRAKQICESAVSTGGRFCVAALRARPFTGSAQGKMGVPAIARRPIPHLRRNALAEFSIHAGGR
jgi:hypothetical protein